ncbi:hypothetical protein AB0M43_14035 [Longispora sp. NPDC051575]|uniref:hypothetical protein n=1 Tax=Longispora sp. NPDC051575 TaxID=3154943 RepID=UPI0034372B55
MSALSVGAEAVSPIKALIRLLAELVLEVHRPAEGTNACEGCAVASASENPFPCWPADTARNALTVVDSG